MLKRFVKDTAIYGITTAVTASLGIVLLPYLARKFSPAEYGVMDLLMAAFNIINVIVPLSITQALARFYPKVQKDEQAIYASTGLWFTVISFLSFLIVSLIFMDTINHIMIGNNAYIEVSNIAFISFFSYGVFTYLQVQLRWMLLPFYYMLGSLVFIVSSAVLTVVFIQYINLGVEGFFYARIAGCVLAGGVCWWYSKNNYQFTFNFEILKKMLAFSSPLVISSVGIFVSIYIDRFIIRGMLTLDDVGIYSVCAKLASVAGTIMTVINFALTPIIYSSYDKPKTKEHLALLFKIIVYAMLIVVLFLMFFAKDILELIAGKAYGEGSHVLICLVASFVITGLYNCAPGLWLANKTKTIASINIIGAIANTILCFVLIPYFHYLGAALATLITSLLTLITLTCFAQRYYHISYDWIKINASILMTLFLSYLIIHK